MTGEVRTVIVTPTPATSAEATQNSASRNSGLSGGAIAGIVIGVLIGLLGLAAAFFFWYRSRRRTPQESGPETAFVPRTGDTSPSNNVPSRQLSQMSSAGLLGSKLSRSNTSGVPVGSDSRSAATTNTLGYDRRSVGTDQRLNPYALYMNEQGRVSNVSFQDAQDYSRQLRVSCFDQSDHVLATNLK